MKKILLLIATIVGFGLSGFAQCTSMVTPSVSIVSDITAVCAGNPVVFTASAGNEGPAPLYEWFIGSISQGAPSSSATFTISSLTPTNNSVSVKLTSNASCLTISVVTSNTIQISVFTGIGSGIIGSDQTICSNSIPLPITEVSSPPTGVSNSILYAWESSTTGTVVWTKIAGATNSTYTPTSVLTADIYYRREVIDAGIPSPCNVVYSNSVHITVVPSVSSGTIGSDQTICSGSAGASFTELTPSSFISTPIYYWEESVNKTTWSDIAGATNKVYTPSPTTDTYYRRTVIDPSAPGVCNVAISNTVKITVALINTSPVAVSINDPGQVCAGIPVTYTATPSNEGTTPSYQWYIGTTPVGTNSTTYTYMSDVSDNGKQLTVKLTSSLACTSGSVTSSPVTLNSISATPTVTVYSSTSITCAGLPVTYTAVATGTGTTPIYQWYVNANPVGTGGTTFTTNALLSSADQVWATMASSIGCILPGAPNPAVSNKVSIVVKPTPAPQIAEADQTICTGESFTLSDADVSFTSVFQWQLNNADIAGATNTSYTATQEGDYTLVENNGVCTSTSSAVHIALDPCADFNTTISGATTITPGQQNVTYSVPNQTGFTYNWSVTGGTIVSGQNTNTITVDWDGGSSSSVSRIATTEQKVSVTETKQSTNLSKTTSLTVNNTTTAITLPFAQSGIQFYPNPATDAFNIVMPQSGTLVKYSITDLNGTAVANGTFTSMGGAEKITTNFNAGLYQVVLTYNETVTCLRLNKVQ